MARIRTIKPEFWDSPSVAKASPWARLLFIAMWNWADDFGRGTANLKELEGFAFPHDDRFADSSGNTVQFRDLVAEVRECFGVLFYEAEKRPYYAIPSWEDHQRNERRAKGSKYPEPPVIIGNGGGVAEIPCIVTEIPRTSGPGTGEQRNRGTEEQGNRGTVTSAPAVLDDEIFNEVWSHWPKKDDKKDALAKWPKAVKESRLPERELADIAMAHGDAYRQFKTKQFTPALVVWLNKGRWDNELPAPEVIQLPAGRVTAGQKARSIADDFRRDGL